MVCRGAHPWCHETPPVPPFASPRHNPLPPLLIWVARAVRAPGQAMRQPANETSSAPRSNSRPRISGQAPSPSSLLAHLTGSPLPTRKILSGFGPPPPPGAVAAGGRNLSQVFTYHGLRTSCRDRFVCRRFGIAFAFGRAYQPIARSLSRVEKPAPFLRTTPANALFRIDFPW
jgi:hypothetical protein